MNVRAVAAAVFALGVLAFTFASGFSIPPHAGAAHPERVEALGAAPLLEVLSGATSGVDVVSLSPAAVRQMEAGVLVVAAPERTPFGAEAGALDGFMADGGTLLVFVTTDVWNPYLSSHGLSVHGSLTIPAANATRERLVIVTLPDELGGGQLFLPNTTALVDPSPEARVVAPAQDLVLDENGNGTIEVPPDRAGSFAVVGTVPVGAGRLVVVASVEAVLGPGIDRNLDGLGRLLDATGGDEGAILDTALHPRGWADVLRAPAGAAAALGHFTLWGFALAVVTLGTAVVLLPALPSAHIERTALDKLTPHSQEVLRRGRP